MPRFFFLLVFLFPASLFSKTIPPFSPLQISLVSLKHPNCYNPLGSVTVLASGGSPGYSYLWSSGETGAVLSGVHAGDYEVVVTDNDGSTASLQMSLVDDFVVPVAVSGPPSTVPCANTPVTLDGTGSSTGPDFAYQWVASNGGHLLSGAQTLYPVVDYAGNFQLTVTNLVNGCTATDATSVTGQNIPPSASATGGVLNCSASWVALSIVYTTQHTTFVWNGPGGFMSNLVNPAVNVAGNYVFTVTDTLTGCFRKSTAVVTSNFTLPNVDADGGGMITCANPSVSLTGTSSTPGVTFLWSGPNGYSSDQQNPVVSSAGTYTLTVTNPVNGCTAADAVTVTSNLTPPSANAAVNGTLTCAIQMVQIFGTSNTSGVQFNWSGPNNFSASTQNVSVSFPGIYILTVTNPSNGCTRTASEAVVQNIAVPNASAAGGVKTCASPTVTLSGNSTTPGVKFNWTGPNGFTSTLQNPSVGTAGTYVLTVTNLQNGCTATATASVTQNTTAPTVTATGGTISCYNPSVQINTTASPQGLSFSWTGPDNFSSSQKNPLVTIPGYYSLTATNPTNGCINTTSVYIDDNTAPPFAYAGDDKSLNCYFSTILVNASFSSTGPNFTYKWTTFDGNIVSGGNSLYPYVNAEGTYTLKITNTQNGCMAFDSMMVMQSAPVTATISQTTPVYCSGGANGSATVMAGGGGQFYTYNWSNGKTTTTITGLSAGTYTVTVTDTEGCSATTSATITQLVLGAAINVVHQSIPGVNNGSATVIGNGGTAPYTAKWSNGPTTLTISNLAPGSYTVTLTDAKGCTVVKSTNVNAANCILSGTISGVNVSCFGANNGTATINLSSSLNPVTYAWSNSGTTKTIGGLAPGTYTVTATDASSCQVVQMVLITGPQQLAVSLTSKSDIHCPGGSDGAISAGVSGGVQPYTYHWSNNASSASISNLAPGAYTLTVNDANNCTNTLSVQINSPAAINISILAKADVPCPGANSGSISVVANGGLPPYRYFWSNGNTASAISGLAPGSYTLTVMDVNDCPKSLSVQIQVSDQLPPVLHLKDIVLDLDNDGSISVSPAMFDNGSTDDCGIAIWSVNPNIFDCSHIGANTVVLTATDPGGHSSTGTATVTIVDNIPPAVTCPSNIVTGACNPVVYFNLPQIVDNCPLNQANLVQLSGLPSGSTFPPRNTVQTFQYTDQSGNTGQCSFEIYVEEAVAFLLNTSPATCGGNCDGSANLVQTSGGSYSLNWSNGQNGLSLSGLCPGNYTTTITDAFNCVQTLNATIAVLDNQPPTLTCPANIETAYCKGPVNFNPPVVTDNCATNPAQIQLIGGLPAGSMFPVGNTLQTFIYTDGGGNIGQCSFSVQVYGPSTQVVSVQDVSCANLCNGSANIAVSGGAGPFNILWSNGQSGVNATNLCAGNYAYTVSDASACMQSGSVSVAQPQVLFLNVDQVLNDHGNTGSGSIQVTPTGGVPPYTFTWTRNGLAYATTEDLANLFQGQYLCTIKDANGCTAGTAALTVSNAVSTKTPDWASRITLAPNPASEKAVLDFNAPLGQTATLRLSDLSGRIVSQQRLEAADRFAILEVSSLPAGLWLVQIQLEDGQQTMRKLMVDR